MKKIILAIIVFVLIGLIALLYFKHDKVEKDTDKNDILWDLNIIDIDNDISALSLKKGDKINIFIKDTNIEDEEFNKAYIENIEIENFKDSKKKVTSNINELQYIEVKIPFEYYGLTSTISFYPSISFNITKSDSNSKLKINTKLYEILDEFYRVKNEN